MRGWNHDIGVTWCPTCPIRGRSKVHSKAGTSGQRSYHTTKRRFVFFLCMKNTLNSINGNYFHSFAVEAMVSLKRSLAIPERLGWESDPCTPSSWEGVTCITNPIGEGFVIYEIDLADKGLKGYISGMITLLQNLNSLDLSDNHLSGTIHSKISSARLELLNLSKNQFTGWFPNELYSILYRGGILDVSGNKGLCGVGIPSLPQCSLWTMVLHSKLFAAAVLILIGLVASTLKLKIAEYDANNPNFLLVVSYGVFRMRVAFYISLFHFLRVVLLYTISDFSVDDSYVLLRLTASEQILFVLCGVCVIVAALRGTWGQAKSYFMSVILCFCLFSMQLSAAASKAIYNRPWLMNLERLWVVINYSVLVCFYHMSESFDLKGYLIARIGIPLLQAMRSISLMHYTYLMLAFCYLVSAIMAY
ncbi:uncharacterized protein LOC103850720 isoform X3 [Brassica rapa]|uniref:uncharacterized protein LOC103850720 isoform X3 n=1 Tax=Brassica campestris TaxID=3711 RepID=UPI00142D5D6C|nr:uncharacterized protein LOC103850720 isoform X3 [Brassica rapa]